MIYTTLFVISNFEVSNPLRSVAYFLGECSLISQ